MVCIRPAVEVYIVRIQPVFDDGEVVRFNQRIRIQQYEVIARSALKTVVTGKALAAVFLIMVMDVELIGERRYDRVRFDFGAVFNDYHLEILVSLLREARQQFFQLVGAVVNGDDDRVAARVQF